MGALIAAAGITAAGAVAAGGMSMAASDKAAKSSAAAGGKLEKRTKQATQSYEEKMDAATQKFVRNQEELRQQVGDINIPQYNWERATYEGIKAANRVTENTIKQVQNLTGRDPREMFDMLAKWEGRLGDQYIQVQQGMPLIEQQQAVVSRMIEGELSDVQRKNLARYNAELLGAGFSSQAAGRTPFIQRPQANLAENILQSSEARRNQGLALAPGVIEQRRGVAATTVGLSEGARGIFNSWMEAAQGFIQPAPQMMALNAQGQESYIRNRMNQLGMMGDIGTGIYGAQQGYAQSMYNAQTGQAMTAFDIAQRNTAANLAAEQSRAEMVRGSTEAVGTALSAGAGAYNKYATAKAAGGGGIVSGYGGKQYAPQTSATGGQYYAPIGSTVYG